MAWMATVTWVSVNPQLQTALQSWMEAWMGPPLLDFLHMPARRLRWLSIKPKFWISPCSRTLSFASTLGPWSSASWPTSSPISTCLPVPEPWASMPWMLPSSSLLQVSAYLLRVQVSWNKVKYLFWTTCQGHFACCRYFYFFKHIANNPLVFIIQIMQHPC